MLSWRVAIVLYLIAGLLYQVIGYQTVNIFLFSFWVNVLFWPIVIFVHWAVTFILVSIAVILIIFALTRLYPNVNKFVNNAWMNLRKKVAL
jgi:hypothetical protein